MRLRRARPAHRPTIVSDQKPAMPLDVYVLMVHALTALEDGDVECAKSRLDLALRKAER